MDSKLGGMGLQGRSDQPPRLTLKMGIHFQTLIVDSIFISEGLTCFHQDEKSNITVIVSKSETFRTIKCRIQTISQKRKAIATQKDGERK